MKINIFVKIALLVMVPATIGLAHCGAGKFVPIQAAPSRAPIVTKEMRPLGIYVSSDRYLYRINDKIKIRVLLKNESSDDFWIYNYFGWGTSASLSVWTKDAKSGKGIAGKYMQDALTPPPTSKDLFTRMSQNYIYGFEDELKIKELNIINSGEYILEIEYHSPIAKEFGLGLPIWSKEMGTVKANPIIIRVTE